ncbi:S8 family peptidase, partial [Streptomyces sp. NPDC049577]
MAHHKRATNRRLLVAISAATAVAAGATVLTLPAGAAPAEGTVYGTHAKGAIDGSYIVMLKDGANKTAAHSVATESKDLAEKYGGKLNRTYNSAV